MKKIFLASFTLFFVVGVHAQLVFQKYYGGASNDEAVGVIAESDHSFFIIANTISYGQGGGEEDAMHIKVDAAGNIVSSTTYGTSPLRERVRAVQKTSDGGYLAIGDKKYSGASDDVYVQKLNSAATQTSLYFYGDNNTGDEEIFAAQEVTAVGYYIMFGFDNYHGSPGGQDAFFKIINAGTGTHVASRYYGGLGWADAAFDGFWSNANGIFFAGRTNSIGAGGFDGLVVRTSNISPYNITWQRAIGGAGDDEFLSMKEVSGSGVICAGYTTNFGAVGEDIFVTRIDLNGNLLWSRRIGGAGNERARCILPTADGGFIIAGHTNSAGAGGEDAFLIKLASDGSTQWARLYGGPANDGFLSLAIRPTSFGYAAVGYTNSFTSGGSDMYFVAVDNTGASSCNQSNWNPTNVTVTPTVTTSGLAVVATGHNSFAQALLTTTPVLATNCNCIEERPRVDIAGPTQVCRNQTNVSFSIPAITGVTTYNWTATNATITSPLNSTSVNINFGTNNSQIIVQAIYGNCSTFNIDTINVTIDPVTANIPAVAPICIGQSVTLNANAIAPVSGVSGYLWNTGASTSSINVTPAVGNTVYTVTITDGLGCTATATQTVVVNPLPIPTASSNSPVCAGNTINLTSGGGVSYSWIGPNAFSNNTQNPSIASANSSHAGTYTVTVTDANTCTASITTNVVVNPLPIPTASSNSPVCVGEAINLTSGGGVSYSWIGPNAFSNNTQNPSIASATSSHAGTYTVTVTDANTCTASITTNVVVNPLPTPIASNNGPLCINNTLELYVTAAVSYNWSGPNAFTSTSQNPVLPLVTLAENGTYTVTVTDINGCTATSTTAVTVSPSLSFSATSNSPLCVGETLSFTSSPGSSHVWIGPNAFSSSTENPVINGVTLSAAGVYTVTVTNLQGCTGSSSINVVINPLPVVNLGNDTLVCGSISLQLDAGNSGSSYVWNDGSSSQTLSVNAPGIYMVTVTDANGCSANDQLVITTETLPIVDLGPDQVICEGSTVILDASNTNATYLWSTGATTASITVSAEATYTVTVYKCNTSVTDQVLITVDEIELLTQNQVNPDCGMNNGEITLSVNGGMGMLSYAWQQLPAQTGSAATGLVEGSYNVVVTDAQGCTDAITVTLICISPEIIIPQFISPNGDGKNDVLIIQNLMPSYTNNIFKIFNRWGNEVYVSSPYQNNWDGRSNTGLSIGSSILPAGTYFYVLDLQGDGSDVRTGFVELQP